MDTERCAIPGCGDPVSSREWCSSHYRRWLRWGTPYGQDPTTYLFAPLEQHVFPGRRPHRMVDCPDCDGRTNALCYTLGDLAEALGCDDKALIRWRKRGLPAGTADRFAVRLGSHPALIWPDWNDWYDPYESEVA